MTDLDDAPKRMEEVHKHIAIADKALAEMAEEIDRAIIAAVNEEGATVDYDRHDQRFIAELPLEEIARNLRQRSDFNLFTQVKDGKIRIIDHMQLLREAAERHEKK